MPEREPEIIAVGEAMAVLLPIPGDPDRLALGVGGAEFNVATTLARLGHPTTWISRVGDDDFGRRVLAVAERAGVTTAIDIDPERRTGLYRKELVDGRSTMRYYRADSAAAAMTPALLDTASAALASAPVIHVSGITPALSDSAAATALALRAHAPHATLSVDLNLRPALWHGRDRAPLDALVAQADLLFTGADEAREHLGYDDPERLLAHHPALRTLVVKDDARAASSYLRTASGIEAATIPALRVDVTDPIGAGDAFAAGYLAALLDGVDAASRLRIAHALAALALVVQEDRPATVPDADEVRRIAAGDGWETWRVTASSTPWSAT